MVTVTFWKSDFAGESLQQLSDILTQYSTKGIGCWFINKSNFIQACLPEESDYIWIMDKVANYGDVNINR